MFKWRLRVPIQPPPMIPPSTCGNAFLSIQDIHKSFGDTPVLQNINIQVNRGEFVTLLGPSGCGKTTLLRILAGLELPDSGNIFLDGQHLTHAPAYTRPVNTVFQNYALFPHLNVYENIAFGLKSRKKPAQEIKEKVAKSLALVQLEAFQNRSPNQLSGGQKQRVALARALVNEPLLLLLDEPMSALDAKLRNELQVELRRIQRNSNTTFILVTHDQDEALTVSDRIFVMKEGHIEQCGSPSEIYEKPTSRFVAEFLGSANLIQAHRNGSALVHTALGDFALSQKPNWQTGTIMIRPERIRICDSPAEINGLSVTIQDAIYRGDHCEVLVNPGALRIRTAPTTTLVPNNKLSIQLPPEYIEVLRD